MKGMTEAFLLDTYALVEIIKGNKSYARYMDGRITTTRLNLMELYYSLLRDFNTATANKFYGFFLQFVLEIEDNVIKEAMVFKLANKRENLSYVDCIGYIMSLSHGIKFLSGDQKFNGKDNVEFVK